MSSYKSGNPSGNGCEACRIKDRYALYDVKFYGYKYDRRSLKVSWFVFKVSVYVISLFGQLVFIYADYNQNKIKQHD